MKIKVLLFYKYVELDNLEEFREKHLSLCNMLGLKGKIIISKEGINGSVSGEENKTDSYKIELRKDKRFDDIIFKDEISELVPFKRMIVKIKNEIIKSNFNVNVNNTGKHISPSELMNLYKKNEDFLIIDARNNYESEIGKFKNAITPNIKRFHEFPKIVSLLKGKENSKIVLYCTGGIRCEKASAYLKKEGFNDVYQLGGGILTFGKEIPESGIWEGKCFVFDSRVTSDMK